MVEKSVNTLLNTELLSTNFSEEQWLSWVKKHQGENIFFGIGLMTSTAFSEAIPFDILGMFFIAELMRRALNSEKVFVLVADQHANTNGLATTEIVEAISERTILTLQSIIQAFDFHHFQIIQTTLLYLDGEMQAILQQLPAISNAYLKHEVADTLWLHQHHNVGVKLGWSMSKEQSAQGHDERFFDSEIRKFSSDISFIHMKPGRTGNTMRQRVSPYVSIAGEDRLILRNGENAQEKMSRWRRDPRNSAAKPLLRHISQIVRLHEKLFASIIAKSLDEKVQMLIDKTTK
jgi:hypothetical protein